MRRIRTTSRETSRTACVRTILFVLGVLALSPGSSGQSPLPVNATGHPEELLKFTTEKSWRGDEYGAAVALDGSLAVVGAPRNNELGDDAGAVYVHERGPNGWTETRLTAPDGFDGYLFGQAVAISGETILVGSPHAACGSSQGHDTQCGAAFVFRRDATGGWVGGRLVGQGVNAWDWFGASVAIQGDTAVVGAYGDDDRGPDAGAAYVFERGPQGSWVQSAKLTAPDGRSLDWLGWSVALDGDVVVVGAYNSDGFGPKGSGSLYVFSKDASGQWGEEAELSAEDAQPWDHLGRAVAVQGNTVMGGSHRNSELGYSSGAVYVFDKSPTGWTQSQKLLPSQPVTTGTLGVSLAISGNTAVAGAPGDVEGGVRTGSVYVYERTPNGWNETQRLLASDGAELDFFGISAALSGSFLLTGARRDDLVTGSAYLFSLH